MGQRLKKPVFPTGGDESDAPPCPRCGHAMMAHDLLPARRDNVILFRAGSPPPPRRALPIWRCSACAIDTPRIAL